MDLARFEQPVLLPKAAAYRALLDDATTARGWEIAAAVTTIFLEGTNYERGEIEPGAKKRPQARLSDHPLVKHYGLPVEHLALTKAHRAVEGDHRAAAWRVMLDHVAEPKRPVVSAWMEDVLAAWLGYRDDVAHVCGLVAGAGGEPRLVHAAD